MGVLAKPTASSDALVLRAWPCGESSAVASLLTRDHGFVKVIAKAARREKSRLRALIEPGRLVTAEFGLDPHRELQFLRGGAVALDPLAQDPTLEKSAFLLGALELVDRCRPSVHGPPARDPGGAGGLFAVCEGFVRMLSSSSCPRPDPLFFALEWELLRLHGVAPEVDRCAGCGNDPTASSGLGLGFSAAEGGVVCADCLQAGVAAAADPLAADAWRFLAEVDRRGLAGAEIEDFPRPLRRAVGAALHGFLGYHLPGYRLPAALDLLRTRKD